MAFQIGQSSHFPISPPYWCTESRRYAVRVESSQQEFVISWETPKFYPDLSQFPSLSGITSVDKVKHSTEEEEIWKGSRFTSFGSYAQIREAIHRKHAAFPIFKLAHASQTARSLIHNEFQVLRALSNQNLPIIRIEEGALMHENCVFGFRMEKLYKISPSRIVDYYDAIEEAVHRIHEKLYVHADLTISNIMLNEEDEIRIIDFGHSGKHGETVPLDHPHRTFKKLDLFHYDIDTVALQSIKAACNY